MRSSDVLQKTRYFFPHAATEQKTQTKSQVEQIVTLGDNVRYHKSNKEWESRLVGKAEMCSTRSVSWHILSTGHSSKLLWFPDNRLKFDLTAILLMWYDPLKRLIESDSPSGQSFKSIQHNKKVVVGFFWPCCGSVSDIIVSDSLAELGGAVMVLRDSLNGLGTATGFVVSFQPWFVAGIPTWHLQGQPQKWNHNGRKRMNPLCHLSSPASPFSQSQIFLSFPSSVISLVCMTHPSSTEALRSLYSSQLLLSPPLLFVFSSVPEKNDAYSAEASGARDISGGGGGGDGDRPLVGLQTYIRPKWRRLGFSGEASNGVGLWELLRVWWCADICHSFERIWQNQLKLY